jgi:hypothetical protein
LDDITIFEGYVKVVPVKLLPVLVVVFTVIVPDVDVFCRTIFVVTVDVPILDVIIPGTTDVFESVNVLLPVKGRLLLLIVLELEKVLAEYIDKDNGKFPDVKYALPVLPDTLLGTIDPAWYPTAIDPVPWFKLPA